MPLGPDELCVHDPGLVHVDHSLARLQELQKSNTKLLPQHQVLLCITFECNSMHLLKSQTKLLSEYLTYLLILYQETIIFFDNMLHHRSLVDDFLLPEQATSLSYHYILEVFLLILLCPLLLQVVNIIFGLFHQVGDSLFLDTHCICHLFLGHLTEQAQVQNLDLLIKIYLAQ